MKKSGKPEVLTINGKAELVVHDAASYQKFLDLIDQAEAIEGIRRGLEDRARGKGRPMRIALGSLTLGACPQMIKASL